MYSTNDLKSAFAVAADYPLAVIAINNPSGGAPLSALVPVLTLEEQNIMEFHIPKWHEANAAFRAGGKVSATFIGPNAHISPSFYKTRFRSGNRSKTAPTWNYIAAKITGALQLMNDNALAAHFARLTGHFEASVQNGWSIKEMDPEFFKQLSARVDGFIISVESGQATHKLSQEQNPEDIPYIIEGLIQRAEGHDLTLAKAMAAYYGMNLE